MLALIIVAGVAMFLGDICQALYVLLELDCPWRASFFDGLCDWTQFFSVGAAGASAVTPQHTLHITGSTVALLAVVMVGSVLGGRLGNHLSRKLKGTT